MKQKQTTGIYLSLVYATFLTGVIFIDIGHLAAYIDVGTYFDLYRALSMVAMAFFIAGILFMVFFHAEITKFKKMNKYIEVAIGIIVIIIILLPFNYTDLSEENDFRLFTYIMMSMFGIIAFAHIAYSYYNIAYKSTQKRKQLNILGHSNVVFLFFYVLMSVYGMTQETIFLVISMVCLYVSFLGYFLAIYLPKLRS
ncbi:MAG: hypothetical protein ACFFAS_17050 [Promethearchaeota archaeon]